MGELGDVAVITSFSEVATVSFSVYDKANDN